MGVSMKTYSLKAKGFFVMGIFMAKDNLWDRMPGGRDNVFRFPFHVCFKNPVSGYVFMWISTIVFMGCMFPSVFSCPVMKKKTKGH